VLVLGLEELYVNKPALKCLSSFLNFPIDLSSLPSPLVFHVTKKQVNGFKKKKNNFKLLYIKLNHVGKVMFMKTHCIVDSLPENRQKPTEFFHR
jgi:hypothetical protein